MSALSQVSLQFHAAPSELTSELLPTWLAGVPFHVVYEREDGRISKPQRCDPGSRCWPVDAKQILLAYQPFRGDPQNSLIIDFMRLNEGFLAVRPGLWSQDGLRESFMGAVAEEPASISRWQKLVQRARRSLLKGAVRVGPSGDRMLDPSHLYSEGAAALARDGVPMLAIAGRVRFELAHVPH